MSYVKKIVDDFREMRVRLGWSIRKASRVIECDHAELSRAENYKAKASPALLQKMVTELDHQGEQHNLHHENAAVV